MFGIDDSLDASLNLYFALNTRIADANTRQQYRLSLANLQEAVGKRLTIGELSDDAVALMMQRLRERGLSPRTINDRRARVHALWSWLCRRGVLAKWPMTPPLIEPTRVPEAWTEQELRKLFQAAALERRQVGGCPAWLWWSCLLSIAWNTGERVGAIMQLKWEHVDMDGRWLHVPAEIRKGKRQDMLYRLAPETMAFLLMQRRHTPEFILPWDRHPSYLWQAFGRLLKSAGLPTDRRSKFHRLRRSVASHYEAAGYDAQRLLGHSARSVTEAYIDPRIVPTIQASDVLFEIGQIAPSRRSRLPPERGVG